MGWQTPPSGGGSYPSRKSSYGSKSNYGPGAQNWSKQTVYPGSEYTTIRRTTPVYEQETMNALQANIAKKKAADAERKANVDAQRKHGWQQPIAFEEYGSKTVLSAPDGGKDIYTGYNISGRPSFGSNGLFEHDHSHQHVDANGNTTFHRGEKGENLKGK